MATLARTTQQVRNVEIWRLRVAIAGSIPKRRDPIAIADKCIAPEIIPDRAA